MASLVNTTVTSAAGSAVALTAKGGNDIVDNILLDLKNNSDATVLNVRNNGALYGLAGTFKPATGSVGLTVGNSTGDTRLDITSSENSDVTFNVCDATGGGTSRALIIETGSSERMRIAADGNVGIGTTSPDNFVHIQESALSGRGASNSNTSLTIEQATDTGIQFFSATQTQIRFGDAASTAAGAIIYAHGDDNFKLNFTDHLTINDGGAEIVRVTSDERVGIGTTNPAKLLELYSTSHVEVILNTTSNTSNCGIDFDLSGTRKGIIRYDHNATDASAKFEFYAGGDTSTPKMVILGGGNVGIGVDAPTSLLHVTGDTGNSHFLAYFYNSGTQTEDNGLNVQIASSGSSAMGLRVNTGGDSNAFIVAGDGDTGLGFTPSNFYQKFNVNGGAYINGAVGIGTTGPTATLQVGTITDSSETAASLVHLLSSTASSTVNGFSTLKLDYKSGHAPNTAGAQIMFNQGYHSGNQDYTAPVGAVRGWKTGPSDNYGGGLQFLYQPNSGSLGVLVGMALNGDGSVGIGTTSPSGPLEVNAPSGWYAENGSKPTVELSYSNTAYGAFFIDSNWGFVIKNPRASSELKLETLSDDILLRPGVSTAVTIKNSSGNVIVNGGSVGIGTTAPITPLDVYHATHSQITVSAPAGHDSSLSLIEQSVSAPFGSASVYGFQWKYDGGDNKLYLSSGVDTNVVNRLTVQRDDGHVGIGTVSPATPLHVYTDSASGQEIMLENDGSGEVGIILRTDRKSNGALTGWIGFDAHDAGDNNTRYATIEAYSTDTTGGSEDGALRFSVMAAGSDVESMTIAAKSGTSEIGWVGVGTNAPSFPFQVLGVSQTNGDAKRVVCILDSTSAAAGTGAGIALGGYTNGTASAINDFGVIQGIKENGTVSNYASAMLFSTRANGGNPTEQMRINSDGEVGIGTNNPTQQLMVWEGSSSVSFGEWNNGAVIWLDGVNGDISGGDYFHILADDSTALRFGYGTVHKVSMLGANGYVGIGTTNPAQMLSVFQGKIGVTDAYMIGNLDGNTGMLTYSSNRVTWEIGGSEKMRLNSSGSVGIGTTGPGTPLDINQTAGDNTYPLKVRGNIDNDGGFTGITFGYEGDTRNYEKARIMVEGTSGNVQPNMHFLLNSGANNSSAVKADARLSILNGGSVGIGVNDPNYKLDIGGTTSSTNNTIRLNQNDGGTAIRIGAGGGSSDVTLLRVDGESSAGNHDGATDSSEYGFSLRYMGSRGGDANSLSLFSDNQTAASQVEAITVYQGGSVGIGTTSPGAALDVAKGSGNILRCKGDSFNTRFAVGASGACTIEANTGSYALDITNSDSGKGGVKVADNVKIAWGGGPDLIIFHDGSNSYVQQGTNANNLNFTYNAGSKFSAIFKDNGDNGVVELYYDGDKKFETASGGVTITGTATATTFSGSGASLTSLNASNLGSGTVPTARLGSGTASSSTYLRGDNTWATVSGGSGTVTSVATSGAITGGTITTSGTITHSTANGYKHIPADGADLKFLAYASAGTAEWAGGLLNYGDYALFAQRYDDGSSGGALSGGQWNTRILNTTVVNNYTTASAWASLGSNQITLQAGTYYARVWAVAYDIDEQQINLANVDTGNTLLLSAPMSTKGTSPSNPAVAMSEGTFAITTNGHEVIAYHWANLAETNTYGGGRPLEGGTANPTAGIDYDYDTYVSVQIWRVA